MSVEVIFRSKNVSECEHKWERDGSCELCDMGVGEYIAQLGEELLKYKDIAHNINESFQLERTENAALKLEVSEFRLLWNIAMTHLTGKQLKSYREQREALLIAEEQEVSA